MTSNARILLIDDDELILNSLALCLELEGYEVDKAENGKEAITKSHSNFYNLAIVDWRLPDIEGTKLLGQLKETTPKMAKIMLTGYPSLNNAVEAINNNADAFFLKPVNFEALLEKIEELLKQQAEAKEYSEDIVANFIETRIKQLDSHTHY